MTSFSCHFIQILTDEEFMKTSRSYLGKSERLPKSIIEISRVKDANIAKRSAAGVQCIEFHPSAKVILTAGLNKTLDLFQVCLIFSCYHYLVFIHHFLKPVW